MTAINHIDLGVRSFTRSRTLYNLIESNEAKLAGNKKLKIYGMLTCLSGKRMSLENRVFFKNEDEAIANGYRPCGNCMRGEYKKWKENNATI